MLSLLFSLCVIFQITGGFVDSSQKFGHGKKLNHHITYTDFLRRGGISAASVTLGRHDIVTDTSLEDTTTMTPVKNSRRPSLSPTNTPTNSPLRKVPTSSPTKAPTNRPSKKNPTTSPTKAPTNRPSKKNPTTSPTKAPTNYPRKAPTRSPSMKSAIPSRSPSNMPMRTSPSNTPSTRPTKTKRPTSIPSRYPIQSSPPSMGKPSTPYHTVQLKCSNYANTGTCNFCACPGDNLDINGKPGCVGDQYLALYDSSGTQNAANNDFSGKCSRIFYTVPNTGSCAAYSVAETCNTGSCQGAVTVMVTGVPAPKSSYQRLPEVEVEDEPSQDQTAGSIQAGAVAYTSVSPTAAPTAITLLPPSPLKTTFSCNPFWASGANQGSCSFCACGSVDLIASGVDAKGMCSGSQELYLVDGDGSSVGISNNYYYVDAKNNNCSQLYYQVPASASCQVYNLLQKCQNFADDDSVPAPYPCGGTISVSLYNYPPGYQRVQAGIQFHGGEIMVGTVNVYLIFYGLWTGQVGLASNAATMALITGFVSQLGGSSWWNILSTYTGLGGAVASTTLKYISSVIIRGNDQMSSPILHSTVKQAISSGLLPLDPNGVYQLIPSESVTETDNFRCSTYCGYHESFSMNGKRIKVAISSHPYACSYPTACSATTYRSDRSPNNNAAADGIISIVAHELAEAVTNPTGFGWYDDETGNENADICAFNFGPLFNGPNGVANSNLILGSNYYLVQQNWVNSGSSGFCAQKYP